MDDDYVRIFVVDNDPKFIENICAYYKKHSVIEVYDWAIDFDQATKKIMTNYLSFDIILLGVLIFEDIEKLLKIIHNNHIDNQIIMIAKIKDYTKYSQFKIYDNICYLLLKPVKLKALEKYILSFRYELYERIKENNIIEKVTVMLHDLGLPSNIKGYYYIRECILKIYDNPELIKALTTQLYPSIANKFLTSPSCVERTIRHAIEISWNRGNYDLLEEMFGHSIDYNRGKPTNSEYLSTIADKLIVEELDYIQ